jgi:hypothetical protein
MKHAFITCPREHLTRSYCASKPGRACFLFLILLVTLSPLRLSAQQNGLILFHGVILDAETHKPLTGAHFQARDRSAGAADERGMVSFYARPHDTIRFTCVGYKDFRMVIGDTLRAKEYIAGIYLTGDTLMIPAVVVIPRMVNIRAEIMADRPAPDHAMINATNNLRISAYQGLTGVNKLGDPASNYELIRQKQRIDAFEKGGIPSGQMVSISPLTLIPLIYVLATGLPEEPEPPTPYLSPRELGQIRALYDSLIYKSK